MSAGVVIDLTRIGGVTVKRRLDQLSRIDTRDLLEVVGAVAESQVRRRLSDEKTTPDGTPWPVLDDDYAEWKRTVSSGGLLQLRGDLTDSIQYFVNGDDLEVGSNLAYAATHNYGDDSRGIPAREYLGLSTGNVDELEEVVVDWLREELGLL